jgi:hypothetical protein
MKKMKWIWALVAAVMLAAPAAWAQDADEAAAPADEPAADGGEAGSLDEFITRSKHPVDWFNWGADLRLREVYTPNLLLDDEDRHFQRYRFRIWSQVTPVENVDVNTRLVFEPRHFCEPDRAAEFRKGRYLDEWTLCEFIVDKANVHWKNIAGLPMWVKVGRQDIIHGNGWLVLDGTPLDGSRTIHFDAVRAGYEMEQIKTKADLAFICQKSDSDYYLPPFPDRGFHNRDSDELGIIAWLTNKSLPNTQLDGFFIWKKDQADLGTEPGDARAGHAAPWQLGHDAEIYTLGARAASDLSDNWKALAQFAYEFGSKDYVDLSAFGFNSRLAYYLRDQWDSNFRVEYEYLSGDDPGTRTSEQFDALWGRWPQFSEMLAYTVGLETGPGEQTNLHRVGLGWTGNPSKKTELAVDYHVLFRDEHSFPGRTRGGDIIFDGGCLKGHLLTGLFKYKFNEHVAGHAVGEVFFPGDYYSDAYNEVGGLMRYEIVFTW